MPSEKKINHRLWTDDILRLPPKERHSKLTAIVNEIYAEANNARYYAQKAAELLDKGPDYVDPHAVRHCLEGSVKSGDLIRRKSVNAGRYLRATYGTEFILTPRPSWKVNYDKYQEKKRQEENERRKDNPGHTDGGEPTEG